MLVKNFSYSITYKILGLLISLSLVPLLIKVLGVENYGLWVTFTSLLVWISLFDFGLGYALKNTVSRAIANNNFLEAQAETKQILKITIAISGLLLVSFIISLFFVEILNKNLYLSVILFVPYILLFPIKIGSQILQGSRKIALESGLIFLNSFLFFISITLIAALKINIDLIYLSILFVSSYFLSISLVWAFSIKAIQIKHINLKEVLEHSIDFKRIKIGLKFFGLQLSSLVLYSMGTLIVFTYLSATDAAHFDVLNRIFLFGLSIFGIGISVYWPEITHHLEKNNFIKIKKLYFIMLSLALVFSLISIALSYVTTEIIKVWTNNKIHINNNEAIYFSFLVSTQAVAYSGAVVLNAFEKINYQLILSILSTILMIPLSWYFIENGHRITSIPLAAGILTLIPAIYCNTHAVILIKKGSKQ